MLLFNPHDLKKTSNEAVIKWEYFVKVPQTSWFHKIVSVSLVVRAMMIFFNPHNFRKRSKRLLSIGNIL